MLQESTPIYRDIPNFPGYRVAAFHDRSEIQSCWKNGSGQRKPLLGDVWNPIPMRIGYGGYLVVSMRVGRFSHTRHVHRLVAENIHGSCQIGMQCRHLNGLAHDNRASNLAWGTCQQNSDDKKLHGTSNSGSRNPMSKLDEASVMNIRKRIETGERLSKIAASFGVNYSQIWRIKNRYRWAHVE